MIGLFLLAAYLIGAALQFKAYADDAEQYCWPLNITDYVCAATWPLHAVANVLVSAQDYINTAVRSVARFLRII